MDRKETPKGKEEINIHIDCNDQTAREKEFWDHIRSSQEAIKDLVGQYFHEVLKARLDELMGQDRRRETPRCIASRTISSTFSESKGLLSGAN